MRRAREGLSERSAGEANAAQAPAPAPATAGRRYARGQRGWNSPRESNMAALRQRLGARGVEQARCGWSRGLLREAEGEAAGWVAVDLLRAEESTAKGDQVPQTLSGSRSGCRDTAGDVDMTPRRHWWKHAESVGPWWCRGQKAGAASIYMYVRTVVFHGRGTASSAVARGRESPGVRAATSRCRRVVPVVGVVVVVVVVVVRLGAAGCMRAMPPSGLRLEIDTTQRDRHVDRLPWAMSPAVFASTQGWRRDDGSG